MKQTAHINIGSQAFTIDQDAYDTLRSYLADIRSRLPESDVEAIGDIETRIAEIFREKIGSSGMRVITIKTVREAMIQMGAPADFGERRDSNGATAQTEQTAQAPARKLYRSRTDRSIAGICGGLAAFFDADPTAVRLVTLLLILFGGLSIWVYLILWFIIPEAPIYTFGTNNKKR